MAVTQTLTQVTWPTAANSISVSANSNQTSEVMTLDASCVAAQIQLKADNSTTPAADDYINFYVLQSSGTPDGAEGTDFYDTTGHAIFLARVQPVTGEDPAAVTVPFPLPQKNFKIYAEGDHTDTTTNAITVSAQVIEQRVS